MLDLGPELLTLILFGSLVIVLLAGVPLVFALGGVATLFVIPIWGWEGLPILANRTYMAMDLFLLVAVPMFIFMGAILQRCGIAEDLYELMYHWMGQLRGGLAAGTVLICTLFAAMVGISGAATTSMGLLALPAMLKRGYKKDIAIGCISAGGALGVLIPPSVLMIILALFARLSIGELFIAGILPGLLLSGLFVAYILIRCAIQKDMGPGVPVEEQLSRAKRFRLLGGLFLPIGLILMVMGSMFFGLATPSEASAIGAFGGLLSAAVKRKLSWSTFVDASFVTLRLSAMVIWIVFAASVFTALYAVTGAADLIADLIGGVGEGWWPIIVMMLIFFVLGMFFDPTGIVLLTTPIFFPLVIELGYDPLWFAILFVINMEMAYITPPFGFNLFYMRAVVPPGITMMDIYKSAIPFVGLQAVALIICMIFPGIITWLPSLMIR
ncbi:MAG: TRAP transporter large permease subunit [Alphaproteobacteria bacterium]|nr:TRAP transporter large permease subunit [Alphaproteobacteria bacterium]